MSEFEQLKEKINEANERLELLSDKGQIDPDILYVELCDISYVPVNFTFIPEDETTFMRIDIMLENYNGSGQQYLEIEVSENFFYKYLNKLRRQCEKTETFTFQEAEPEEYKAAKAAEEAMKSPNFKEIFEFSPDPVRYDTQELWWQQHEGE